MHIKSTWYDRKRCIIVIISTYIRFFSKSVLIHMWKLFEFLHSSIKARPLHPLSSLGCASQGFRSSWLKGQIWCPVSSLDLHLLRICLRLSNLTWDRFCNPEKKFSTHFFLSNENTLIPQTEVWMEITFLDSICALVAMPLKLPVLLSSARFEPPSSQEPSAQTRRQ